jgi:hypothetical protein
LAARKYTRSQSFVIQTLWIAGFTAPQISRAVSSVGMIPMTGKAVSEFIRAYVGIKRGSTTKEQRQTILDEMRANRCDDGMLGPSAFCVVR